MDINVQVKEGKIIVTSPYNADFVDRAKRLGGRWQSPSWVFDIRDEQAVRNLCRTIYGTDGQSIPDVVTIRATLDSSKRAYQGPITLFGRVVARAFGRDSGARLGEGVILVSGRFFSGGSRMNWYTEVKDGTVVRIHDIPRAAAEKAIAAGATWLTIEDDAPVTIDIEALMVERNRIMERLAEIDRLLAEAGDELV
ncbi:MAG TPA: hypothetical protein P5244_04545 [Syntrophales bacterium]|nr:hypothetical protein [Syntrophales bacterium]HRR40484.1 hypothetical protein [Syntrophales bacterium]